MEPLGSIPVGVVHSFELLTNDEFFGVYRKSYQDGSGRITYVIAHLPPIIAYTEPPASVLVEFINKSEAICTFNRWKEDPLLAQPIGRVRDRLPPFARLFQPSILIEKPVTGCTPHLDVIETQESPARFLVLLAARATDHVPALCAEEKMTVDPAAAFIGRFAKAQDLKVVCEG